MVKSWNDTLRKQRDTISKETSAEKSWFHIMIVSYFCTVNKHFYTAKINITIKSYFSVSLEFSIDGKQQVPGGMAETKRFECMKISLFALHRFFMSSPCQQLPTKSPNLMRPDEAQFINYGDVLLSIRSYLHWFDWVFFEVFNIASHTHNNLWSLKAGLVLWHTPLLCYH